MNLSIFNFEVINKLIQLPASTHIRNVSICVAIIFMVCLSSILIQLFHPYKQIKLIKNNELHKSEVLILGNSQFERVDKYMPLYNITNRANGGTSYSVLSYILKKIGPQMPELKVLLLGFDNLPLRVTAIKSMKGDYKRLLSHSLSLNEISEITIWNITRYYILYNRLLKPILIGPKLDIDGINNIRDKIYINRKAIEPTPLIFDPTIVQIGKFSPAEGEKKIAKYIKMHQKNNNLENNTKAFFSILDYCYKNNIRVVLLRSPTTTDFWINRGEWDLELQKLYLEVKSRYPTEEYPIWDSEKSRLFLINNFRDPNHLSGKGLEIYANILEKKLTSLFKISSKN